MTPKRSKVFCLGVEQAEMNMFFPRLSGWSKGTTWEEVKTIVDHQSEECKEKESHDPHFRWSFERRFHIRHEPMNKHAQTTTENQEENSRSVYALSFSSWLVDSLCPANAVDSTFILSFFLLTTT